LVAAERSYPLRGRYWPYEVLERLLRGSGLSYRIEKDNLVIVARALPGDEADAEGPDPSGVRASGRRDARGLLARSDIIEEIVVTAQKREEIQQKVPISITAVSAEDLRHFNVETVQALQLVASGMTTGRVAYNSMTYIRGVGQLSANPGIEQPVAQYSSRQGRYRTGLPLQPPCGRLRRREVSSEIQKWWTPTQTLVWIVLRDDAWVEQCSPLHRGGKFQSWVVDPKQIVDRRVNHAQRSYLGERPGEVLAARHLPVSHSTPPDPGGRTDVRPDGLS